MKPANKEYFKHLSIIVALFILIFASISIGFLPKIITIILICTLFVYFWLLYFGLTLNLGPFKYLSKMFVKDHKDDLKQFERTKQPWQ